MCFRERPTTRNIEVDMSGLLNWLKVAVAMLDIL